MNELSRGRKAAFTIVPIVILFLIAWVILSAVDRERVLVRGDDPAMIYSFYENRDGVAASEEYRTSVHITDRGLRGSEASDGKAEAIFFGDSFAEGWGVEIEKSFPILSGTLAGITTDNAGIHGGFPWYYILRGRHFLKERQYRAILVQLFDNDLKDQDEFLPFIELKGNRMVASHPRGLGPIPPGSLTRFIRDSSPFRIIKRAAFAARGQRLPIKYYKPGREPAGPLLNHMEALEKFGKIKSLADPEQEYGGQFGFYRFKSLAELRKDPDWSRRATGFQNAIRQMIEEFQELQPQAKIHIVYLPAKQVFAPGGAVIGGADGVKLNPMVELIRESILPGSASLIDLRQDLAQSPNSLYFPGDGHLNEQGHAVVSKRLATVLKD
ncbi:MAG: SGNH/GDSL hydrolase family protein [Spirochaetia bacterium]|nr:SGNH/GDSL hydrolase family protein [Spirochaetia bacterium]